jgi:thiamine pyrophosphate-dependent acetolactate synthase large subunit-like protein
MIQSSEITTTGVTVTGKVALLRQLVADGVRYVFGNPGTSEEGFLDVIEDFPELTYVVALQECVAVAAADGYARATRRPAVVQLHSGVGLGNGIGMLYQALRGHAPLVVVAGEAGLRYSAMDAQMATDLVAMAAPVTKWSARVVHPDSLLRVVRRAIKLAATPPMGPVFIALPMDVLDAPNHELVVPTSIPATQATPSEELIATAAAHLATARHPLIVIGDGVAVAGAQPELVEVAELLGAAVWGADCSEVNMPASHPLYQGLLGHMFGEHSRGILQEADAVLVVGTYLLPEVFPSVDGVFAPDCKVVHIDLDAYEIAKNHPVSLGLVADPKLALGALARTLSSTIGADQVWKAAERCARSGAEKRQTDQTAAKQDDELADHVPMRPALFMREMANQLPEDAIVFDEALTSSPDLTRYLVPDRPGQFFQTRGGSLGVGLPGGLGLKLAHPQRTVVAFAGDGGAMYTIQALWTAAHHRIDVKFVICNNRSYRLLKVNLQQYRKDEPGTETPRRTFPASFDLGDPDIDFTRLSEAMGVPALRIERPSQVREGIERALAHDGPFLIDLVIDGDVGVDVAPVRCGQ